MAASYAFYRINLANPGLRTDAGYRSAFCFCFVSQCCCNAFAAGDASSKQTLKHTYQTRLLTCQHVRRLHNEFITMCSRERVAPRQIYIQAAIAPVGPREEHTPRKCHLTNTRCSSPRTKNEQTQQIIGVMTFPYHIITHHQPSPYTI